MLKIRFSGRADRDMYEIGLFIAEDRPDAAAKWVQELDVVFTKLAERPGIGRDRSELAAGVRSWPFGAYLVFYRVDADENSITILRVQHGARDLSKLF